jgi:hypothetical protein
LSDIFFFRKKRKAIQRECCPTFTTLSSPLLSQISTPYCVLPLAFPICSSIRRASSECVQTRGSVVSGVCVYFCALKVNIGSLWWRRVRINKTAIKNGMNSFLKPDPWQRRTINLRTHSTRCHSGGDGVLFVNIQRRCLWRITRQIMGNSTAHTIPPTDVCFMAVIPTHRLFDCELMREATNHSLNLVANFWWNYVLVYTKARLN